MRAHRVAAPYSIILLLVALLTAAGMARGASAAVPWMAFCEVPQGARYVVGTHWLADGSGASPAIHVCCDDSSATLVYFRAAAGDFDPASYEVRVLGEEQNPRLVGSFAESRIEGPLGDPRAGMETGVWMRARYRHPARFVAAGGGASPSSSLLTAQIRRNGEEIGVVTLRRWPAPVVMVHGVWADRSSFEAMEAYLLETGNYAKELLWRVDYKPTNSQRFATNQRVVERNVDAALFAAVQAGYSAGRVSIVGHSMGGLLSRIYIESARYSDNVNRLITLNSPHAGSQCPNYLLSDSSGAAFLRGFLNLVGNDTSGGAVEDLSVTSAATDEFLNRRYRGIANYPVPVESVVTHADLTKSLTELTSAGETLEASFRGAIRFAAVLDGYSFIPDIFNPGEISTAVEVELLNGVFADENSDLIVPSSSQKAGLETFLFVKPQWHVGAAANANVEEQAHNLLLADREDPLLFSQTGFHPPDLGYTYTNPNRPAGRGDREAAAATTETLEILSPAPGAIVRSGSKVTFSASGSGLPEFAIFWVQGANFSKLTSAVGLPASTEIRIPSNVIGKMTVAVSAISILGDATWVPVSSTFYALPPVNAANTVEDLEIIPTSRSTAGVLIPVGGSVPFEATAVTRGGVRYPCQELPGFSIVATGESVVSVGAGGIVSGVREGPTTLQFSYDGVTRDVAAQVVSAWSYEKSPGAASVFLGLRPLAPRDGVYLEDANGDGVVDAGDTLAQRN